MWLRQALGHHAHCRRIARFASPDRPVGQLWEMTRKICNARALSVAPEGDPSSGQDQRGCKPGVWDESAYEAENREQNLAVFLKTCSSHKRKEEGGSGRKQREVVWERPCKLELTPADLFPGSLLL